MEEQVEMVSTSMMLWHSHVTLAMLCKDQAKHTVRLIDNGATHLQYAKVWSKHLQISNSVGKLSLENKLKAKGHDQDKMCIKKACLTNNHVIHSCFIFQLGLSYIQKVIRTAVAEKRFYVFAVFVDFVK